ncbi:MAG: translocation/assembly module TamB domain-containing protein [Ferruginibacter sp.]
MTKKIILLWLSKFVLYILLFVPVVLSAAFINTSYEKETARIEWVHPKLSRQQVVCGDTNHVPASVGVPTDRNQERQFGMHPIEGQSFLENKLQSKIPKGVGDFSLLKWIRSFPVHITGDTIPFSIMRKDQKNVSRYLISGTFFIGDKSISFSLRDSVVLNYKKWDVSPNNRIRYTPRGILVTDFLLSNDSAKIALISQQNLAGSAIEISILNFDTRDIEGIFKKLTSIVSGILDAKILISGPGKMVPAFIGEASIRKFELMDQPVGDLRLNAQKVDENTIHGTLDLAENGNEVIAGGNFFLNKGLQQLDVLFNIKKLQLAALQGFTKGNMKVASGTVNGAIALKGKLGRPEWTGAINFDTAKFMLNQSGVNYSIDKQKILFDYPAISLNQFTIKDSLDHSLIINGNLCSGTLTGYDLAIDLNSRDFILINAPKAINNQVYGDAGIDGNVSIRGNTVSPSIKGDIYLNEKTNIALVVPETNIDKDAAGSVVRFIDRDTYPLPELKTFKPAPEPGVNFEQYLNHKLNIHVDTQAVLTIAIDPSTGDEISVRGDALLNTGVGPGGNSLVAGTYLINSGYYELNYEFLKKRFNIIKGSTIYFGGGPADARIDITAEYIANTSPKDLLGNEVGSIDPKTARSFNQKIPFRVILFLRGSLKRPEIRFDIELPREGMMSRQLRTTIENKLVQLRTDKAATNKQVFALLALERFVGEQSTDFFKGNGGNFSDLARESVSKFLSAALDQIASDLFRGINIDLNLNSYKDFANSEKTQKTDLNVEVSKSFLNDRLSVTVGKNFGIESQDGSTKASQQKASRFLPDVTVNSKLSADGKYMIRSYKKGPTDVILDGYVVETGLAFIITMDYDKFRELFIKNRKSPDH